MKIIGVCGNCKLCGHTYDRTSDGTLVVKDYYCCHKDTEIYRAFNAMDGYNGTKGKEYFRQELTKNSYGKVQASHTCDNHKFNSGIVANKTRSPRNIRKL